MTEPTSLSTAQRFGVAVATAAAARNPCCDALVADARGEVDAAWSKMRWRPRR